MAEVRMRDVSRSGHVLGGSLVVGLPDRLSAGALLAARIRADVAAYNADPGPVYRGLVQPEDAVRHRDGAHMARPRELDAGPMVVAAEEAAAAGMLHLETGGRAVTDLAQELDLVVDDEVDVVLSRSVVARGA